MKVLILSDARIGHLNQSIAFCKYKNLEYEIINISYKCKILKLLSYIFDFLGIYIQIFSYTKALGHEFKLIISAGSSTYYALKYFSKKYNAKSVAMMYPSGFRKDFDLFFTTSHDFKKYYKNSVILPVNVSFTQSKNYYIPQKNSIAFIIGGGNKNLKFDQKKLMEQILNIIKSFQNYEILITTSPRTPKEFELELDKISFDFRVDYSKNPINPIGDFLTHCEYVFITQDSTSMISEAVCFANASVEILPLISTKTNKHKNFIKLLEKDNFLHIYNNTHSKEKTIKFPLENLIKSIKI